MQRESARWLVLEGTAIVASILLAFAIDAWWQNAQQDRQEQLLLASLREEIASNLQGLERARLFNEQVVAAGNRLFQLASSDLPRAPSEIDSLMGRVSWWHQAPFSDGTLQSIISAGNLELVADTELRARIASMPSGTRFLQNIERQQYEVLVNHYWPYLAQHGYLPQISAKAAEDGMPGIPEWPNTAQRYALLEPATDHSPLLNDRHFLGILLMKLSCHEDALNAYSIAQSFMQDTIKMIDRRAGTGVTP